MTASSGRTALQPFANTLFGNVITVGGFAGFFIETSKNILKNSFLVTKILASGAVELP